MYHVPLIKEVIILADVFRFLLSIVIKHPQTFQFLLFYLSNIWSWSQNRSSVPDNRALCLRTLCWECGSDNLDDQNICGAQCPEHLLNIRCTQDHPEKETIPLWLCCLYCTVPSPTMFKILYWAICNTSQTNIVMPVGFTVPTGQVSLLHS